MSLLKKASSFRPLHKTGDVHELLSTIEMIYHIRDFDSLLETILLEARRFVNADAGTIYLSAGNKLYFSYMQNDTLFPEGSKEKYLGSNLSIPIDRSSIAGYAALSGESLLIDDVYDIRSNVSYNFNPNFDEKFSYRTQSILVVPLLTRDNALLGVIQLINAKDSAGKVVPFSMQDRLYISQFAQSAANAIEKAKLSREMVLRLVEVVELRDPFETASHVKRVGAFSVELYESWASKHGISVRERTQVKDMLRTAAILHDIGKVAVSDVILKKPGSLTEEERRQIKMHTIQGARLFQRSSSAWDVFAAEVTLNHHERWDGTGYPGKIPDIVQYKTPEFGPGKARDEIPLSARIVSITDTFDALVSKRAYKDAWEEDAAFHFLKEQKGRFFDPELVYIFLCIEGTVQAIRDRYLDTYSADVFEDHLRELEE